MHQRSALSIQKLNNDFFYSYDIMLNNFFIISYNEIALKVIS